MGKKSSSVIQKIGQALVVGLLAITFVVPGLAMAQTPDPKTSFDPEVNPMLKAENLELNKYSQERGLSNPYTTPDEPGAKFHRYKIKGQGGAYADVRKGTLQADGKFRLCDADVGILNPGGEGTTDFSNGNCKLSDGTALDPAPEVTTEADKAEATGAAIVDAASGAAFGLIGDTLAIIALFILSIATFLLYMIGAAFNWVITVTVFEFGAYFGASANMLVAWGVLRDIGNIVLLFGFIFMGVLTVLNLHDYPVKKTIPSLIMFAVLLNFSLFAAQVVIDVSNVFSSVFYEQASGSCPDTMKALECAKASDSGISGMIIQQAGIATVFNVDMDSFNLEPMSKGLIFLGLAIFVTITAIVLLAATIMLVIRAVVLSFLMVISPIGFAGMAIPPLKGFAKDWWHQLINQAFFAPVFLLLIFISLKITETLTSGVGGENGLANALAGGKVSGMGIVISFSVVIGFMVMSLVASKKMGAAGASFATKTAGSLVGGATIGTAGWVGRRTAGIGSAKIAGAIRGSALGRTEIGRHMATFADKGAHASFDARNLKFVGAAAGAGGLDLGKGQKGGIHAEEEKATKARLEYAKTIEQTAEEKSREKTIEAAKKAAEVAFKEEQRVREAKIERTNSWVEEAKKEDAAINARDTEERSAQRRKLATAEEQLMTAEIEGDPEKVRRAQESVTRERAALDSLVSSQTAAASARKTAIDTETSALNSLKKTVKDAAEEHKKVIEKADADIKKVNKNAGKLEYAERLEKPGAFGRAINTYSLGGHAAHEAAEKIKKEANKSKLDKIFDDLKGEMSSKGKGDDHGHGGGGDDHGSGGHAAPKKAAKKDDHGGGDHGHH